MAENATTDAAATKNPKGGPPRVVRGRIIHPDGTSVAGEHVQAFAKRLRCDDAPLGGPVQTDEGARSSIARRFT